MLSTKEVNVLEMAKGAILEQIENETTKIMANILDPNTDAKKARKLTISLTFKSDENREFIGVESQTKSTLVPVMPIATKIIVEADREGKPKFAELTKDDPNQVHMFEDNQEEKVLKLGVVK